MQLGGLNACHNVKDELQEHKVDALLVDKRSEPKFREWSRLGAWV